MAFGAGVAFAYLKGTEANDPFEVKDGQVVTKTNNAGGVNGGITNGMPVVVEAVFRATPSISLPQQTVDLTEHTDAQLVISGRHDPCILPRAVVVVEAACALAACQVLGI
ncbi:Chorismate synthase [bioreactor metagenome]|uniref:chorismate synthase n=1 Tax=bioreactor metagenome TaxID=1076179 RepID=A0A645BL68_9ZZZZ